MWQPAAALSTITVIGVIGRELIQRTTQEKSSLFQRERRDDITLVENVGGNAQIKSLETLQCTF